MNMKILIIEDSEDDRMLYSRALKKSPDVIYQIREADNGETGLREVEKFSPDCILLDYSLPGHNGIEVLKSIRANHPFMAIVMMTGQGNEAIAVSAIQEGAQDYINKSNITFENLRRI